MRYDDHIGAYYKVHAICYLNGETYITGLYYLTNAGDADDGFSYWDEGKKRWEPVTNQVPDSINMGYGIFKMSIAVYRNKIYLLSVLTNGEERNAYLHGMERSIVNYPTYPIIILAIVVLLLPILVCIWQAG